MILVKSRSLMAATVLLGLLSGCRTSGRVQEELEDLARDWCMTIRASQVFPVYPLTEDVQPGDVFGVSLPISEQSRAFDAAGFLPLDQRVVRLRDLPYPEFYRSSYWTGTYSKTPHGRPGWETDEARAPRAAFPTYTVSVDRSAGLKLAVPIQSIPVGLGLLGADKARASVSLDDAYTYGLSVSDLYPLLLDWAGDPEVQAALSDVEYQVRGEVYLRIVTQVFLIRSVKVTVTNLSARSGGLDVGAGPELELLDLAAEDPERAESALRAYERAADAISDRLNDVSAGPGGSLRLAQATRRSVVLDENFDRPLVVGYQAFDVKILRGGRLSAPIPSWTVLKLSEENLPGPTLRPGIVYGRDTNSNLLADWLGGRIASRADAAMAIEPGGRRERLLEWLDENDYAEISVTEFLNSSEFREARAVALHALGVETEDTP